MTVNHVLTPSVNTALTTIPAGRRYTLLSLQISRYLHHRRALDKIGLF
jgi:hypothetical protein